MLTFEFEEPQESVCDCCGNVSVRLTRFVYRDGDAYAVCYAQFTKDHPEKRLSGIISLGEWGDDVPPEDRVAFPFQIWTDKHNFQVGLVNANSSPWRHVTLMGRILDRDEALKHPWLSEVFHITDHMVADDPQITGFFGATG
ncbi:hypothetical protein [Nitrospirillum iridis]|uniref:Uncharacterized protein n=1 Tax=Nitrospirillum iridis TaxID=765888 RepID=A0A7X0ECW3_9PROT|nr:hypothetical protein [Nitrospirillum iridis]MBB6251505.1 hypothetical protein [Nitrospirillum iridis]